MKVVVSGPNFTSGGPLSVMRDLLAELASRDELDTTAIVHSTDLYPEEIYKPINFIALPDSKSAWKKRLRYEYISFKKLSEEIMPDIWLSMHDITPNVTTRFLATYCHNPSPFYRIGWRDALYDKKFVLFSLFYKYLYSINIQKNDAVFVQQGWMKAAFEQMFAHPNIVVSRPDIHMPRINCSQVVVGADHVFFYPAFPRVFKNFEVICAAVKKLEDQGVNGFRVKLTIDGTENSYSKSIVERYSSVSSIEFLGLQSREQVFELYKSTDTLIFPSKLETWGLPLSEFQLLRKPILAADLPYAHETIGEYKSVDFFDPHDSGKLAKLMKRQISGGCIAYRGNSFIDSDVLSGWNDFVDFVVRSYEEKLTA